MAGPGADQDKEKIVQNNDNTLDTNAAGAAASRQPRSFSLETIEETQVPEGSSEQCWFRYVIANGSSTITGQRAGTRAEVTEYATRYAEQLNQRSNGRSSTWTPRAKKPS